MEEFSCASCPRSFQTYGAIRAHVKRYHGHLTLKPSNTSGRSTAQIVSDVEARIASHLVNASTVGEVWSAYQDGLRIAAIGVPRPTRSKVMEMYPGFTTVNISEFLAAWGRA